MCERHCSATNRLSGVTKWKANGAWHAVKQWPTGIQVAGYVEVAETNGFGFGMYWESISVRGPAENDFDAYLDPENIPNSQDLFNLSFLRPTTPRKKIIFRTISVGAVTLCAKWLNPVSLRKFKQESLAVAGKPLDADVNFDRCRVCMQAVVRFVSEF